MVLAFQAGLVSQELLGALTAVDDDLCSACLFAEYWTRIRIGMHGCDNTFRLSSTVSRFSYISGVVNSQRVGPEVRFTSQFFVLLLRASLQRLPRSQLQEGMRVRGVTLPLPRAVDTDRANLLLNLLLDHCFLKLHVSKKNTNRYWKLR